MFLLLFELLFPGLPFEFPGLPFDPLLELEVLVPGLPFDPLLPRLPLFLLLFESFVPGLPFEPLLEFGLLMPGLPFEPLLAGLPLFLLLFEVLVPGLPFEEPVLAEVLVPGLPFDPLLELVLVDLGTPLFLLLFEVLVPVLPVDEPLLFDVLVPGLPFEVLVPGLPFDPFDSGLAPEFDDVELTLCAETVITPRTAVNARKAIGLIVFMSHCSFAFLNLRRRAYTRASLNWDPKKSQLGKYSRIKFSFGEVILCAAKMAGFRRPFLSHLTVINGCRSIPNTQWFCFHDHP